MTPEPPADAGSYPEPIEVPRYMPGAVTAEKAMVATAHPVASRIGTEVLRNGGNAIDALVAVQMALNVVEPQSSGIGGGCFILYFDQRSGQTFCLDGREEVPSQAKREDFLDEAGRVRADDLTGPQAAGIPGTVAAMWLAHATWGRVPIGQLLEPAIDLAEQGIGITPRLRVSIEVNRPRFLRFPSSAAVFLHGDGSVPELGEVLRQPDLAQTFRVLAKDGPESFYRGELARDMAKAVAEAPVRPARWAREDLENYEAVFRDPVRFSYRFCEIVSTPPPSAGGITLGLILGALEYMHVRHLPHASVKEIDWWARVCNAAFADREANLGDPDWNADLDMRALLSVEHVRQRYETAKGAVPGRRIPGQPVAARGTETTHISIVDAERNVVSCTTTIEHGMGCGMIVPGRGFLLNNELTDFDLEKTAGPNALDTSRRLRRAIVAPPEATSSPPVRSGGKRPLSSMSPAIVFHRGNPYLTIGSPGGSRIIDTVAQIISHVIDRGWDIQEAINAPRVSSHNGPIALEVLYEKRSKLEKALRARGWRVQSLKPWYEAWGGAQGIRLRPDGMLEGGADPRREGAARGF